jgi:hypothetical protein
MQLVEEMFQIKFVVINKTQTYILCSVILFFLEGE